MFDRCARAALQSAKSALVGGGVDSFSNIDTLKLFANRNQITADHKIDLERTREALFITRKISVSLRTTITALEGLMIVGFVGYGIWLWSVGSASIGLIGAAMALSLRITTMAEWVFDALQLMVRISVL